MSALDALLYGYRTMLAATVEKAHRSKLNFSSAFTLTDNASTSSTDVGLATSLTIATLVATALTGGVVRLTPENNALAGSQNDLTIGASVSWVRFTDAGLVTLTGIAHDSTSRVLVVQAVGAGGVQLNHADAASVATNRFALLGAANATLATNALALLVYDVAMTRWLLVARSS